jgi:hypothetical protein
MPRNLAKIKPSPYGYRRGISGPKDKVFGIFWGCPTCRSRLDVEKTSVNSGIFTTTTLWHDIRALHFVLALTSALACAGRSPFFSDYGCVFFCGSIHMMFFKSIKSHCLSTCFVFRNPHTHRYAPFLTNAGID